MNATNQHDDGLEWLQEVRRKHMHEAGGDLKRLGDRYRRVQAEHPEKVINPSKFLAETIRSATK